MSTPFIPFTYIPYSDKVNIYMNECFIPLPPWRACPPPSIECPPVYELKFNQTINKVK